MAVTGRDGDPIGSLAITGPTYRCREENLHNYLPSIPEERVAEIESALDWWQTIMNSRRTYRYGDDTREQRNTE